MNEIKSVSSSSDAHHKISARAFAPATVANVCCGFDILGFSMDFPGDEVRVTFSENPGIVITKIEGDHGRLPREPEKNTAAVAVQSYLNELGSSQGIEIELYKFLPMGSGMGSSAASGVAALVAVNELMGNPLTRHQLVPHAMEAERIACGSAHADNVAPSLIGGFVLIRDYHPLDIIAIPFPEGLHCTLIHPQMELKTSDSRRVLKPSISLRDAVTQGGNIAGLMAGLMKSDYGLISRSLRDVIAEPIRSVFIPGFDTIRETVLKAGALGCGISGSGPAIFVLSKDQSTAQRAGEAVQIHFLTHQLKSEVYVSRINPVGARVV
jgi:homoserine kinase